MIIIKSKWCKIIIIFNEIFTIVLLILFWIFNFFNLISQLNNEHNFVFYFDLNRADSAIDRDEEMIPYLLMVTRTESDDGYKPNYLYYLYLTNEQTNYCFNAFFISFSLLVFCLFIQWMILIISIIYFIHI